MALGLSFSAGSDDSVDGFVHDGARTADVHAHEADAALAEHGAGVHAYLGIEGKEALQLALRREAERRAVEEDEEAGLWHDGADAGTFLCQAFHDEVDVPLHVVEHLLLPLAALVAVAGHHAVAGKDVAEVLVRTPDVVEVALAELLVVDDGMARHDAGHVEGLGGSLQGDADAACFVADAGEGDVPASVVEHVAMYLVAHHNDTFLGTDVSHLLQVFLRPADAAGVVGVAENHQPTALDVAPECLEVHREGGLCAAQRRLYHLALAGFGHKAEGMVDGFLYEDAVALLGERLHGEEDAAHHAGHVAQHLACDVHAVLRLVPAADALVVGRILAGVAQDALLQAFPDGFHDEGRRAEVHIGHPHRDEVVAAALVFHAVCLDCISSLARNNLVEVVFHVLGVFPRKVTNYLSHRIVLPLFSACPT